MTAYLTPSDRIRLARLEQIKQELVTAEAARVACGSLALPAGYIVQGNPFGATWQYGRPTLDGLKISGRMFDSREEAVSAAWASSNRRQLLNARQGR